LLILYDFGLSKLSPQRSLRTSAENAEKNYLTQTRGSGSSMEVGGKNLGSEHTSADVLPENASNALDVAGLSCC
jgi:hypothetical protein